MQDIMAFAVHNLSLGSRGDGQDSGASCLFGYYGDGIRRDVAFYWFKKTSFGSLRQLIVVQGEHLPGLQAIVILQHSKSSTTK
ncbi:hypothetical protein [Candidatus Lariskella endosymbiont of Hedychridium roseum]|uniref:hypothetical protein n=1 Tax=Candidatus Lariskella endosymbiont of Hedychridium roseum TaxID=3077949 RepID=UPI0030CF3E5E